MTMNSTRQEEQNHRNGKLRRQSCGFLFGLRHAHVAIFLRHDPEHCGKRGAVALRLLQRHADRFDPIQIDALGKVLIGLTPIRQIRQFGSGQGELFGQSDRFASQFRR